MIGSTAVRVSGCFDGIAYALVMTDPADKAGDRFGQPDLSPGVPHPAIATRRTGRFRRRPEFRASVAVHRAGALDELELRSWLRLALYLRCVPRTARDCSAACACPARFSSHGKALARLSGEPDRACRGRPRPPPTDRRDRPIYSVVAVDRTVPADSGRPDYPPICSSDCDLRRCCSLGSSPPAADPTGDRPAAAAPADRAIQRRAFAAHLGRVRTDLVSVLALGIDAAAHRGALESDGGNLGGARHGDRLVYPASTCTAARIAQVGRVAVLITLSGMRLCAPVSAPQPGNRCARARRAGGLGRTALGFADHFTGWRRTGRDVWPSRGRFIRRYARCHRLIRYGRSPGLVGAGRARMSLRMTPGTNRGCPRPRLTLDPAMRRVAVRWRRPVDLARSPTHRAGSLCCRRGC